MKKILLKLTVLLLPLLMISCGGSGNGELIGVQDRPVFYQPDPYGMVFIPMGSYTMGAADQDVPYALVHQPKTASLQAFYMDETEITNNEYRQFVFWVRDSLARTLLGDLFPEDYLIEEDEYGNLIDPPRLNWDMEIIWDGEEEREALEELYYPEHERFYRRRAIDPRKLNFEYYWIDYMAAAKKDFSETNNEAGSWANRPQGIRDRSVFIRKE
ncbi:MAG: SUMF1/EgtB/PvdO family nonheme iron enzyme, partial [Bacteroidales bacterium]|nr:SUMF1/EgtB/PvdO family nonheme iron enzyme [Bacteroidales bacterium]